MPACWVDCSPVVPSCWSPATPATTDFRTKSHLPPGVGCGLNASGCLFCLPNGYANPLQGSTCLLAIIPMLRGVSRTVPMYCAGLPLLGLGGQRPPTWYLNHLMLVQMSMGRTVWCNFYFILYYFFAIAFSRKAFFEFVGMITITQGGNMQVARFAFLLHIRKF